MALGPVKIPIQYHILVRRDGGKVSVILSIWRDNHRIEIWKGSANEPPKRLAHIITKKDANKDSRYIAVTYEVEYRRDSTIQVKVSGQTIFNGYPSNLPRLLTHLSPPIQAAAA